MKAVLLVAILYFDNNTGDPANDVLGKGLADMMVTDVAGVPGVQVVEREKLQALVDELKLQRTRYFDPATAQKIGKIAGAEYAVTGAFAQVKPELRIDVRVIKIATGEVVVARKVVGREDRFFELQDQLAATLAEALGARVAAQNHVDDLATARDYGRGLDLRDKGDLKGASAEMQKVVEKAPRFTLAKTRQMEILKALYAAKDTRARALESSDQKLLALLDERIPRKSDPAERIGLRILRGDLFLRRVAQSPSRADLAAYVQNQETLLGELLAFARANPTMYDLSVMSACLRCVDAEMQPLVRELGLEHPGTMRNTSPDGMVEQLVELVMFGIAPDGLHGPRIRLPKPICYHKLDPAYPKQMLAWLGRAQGAIDAQAASDKDRAGAWKDNRTIEVRQYEAVIHAAIGQPEEAVAKLQGVLTRYPKSPKFTETEQLLRAVLAGGAGVIPPCEDPK